MDVVINGIRSMPDFNCAANRDYNHAMEYNYL